MKRLLAIAVITALTAGCSSRLPFDNALVNDAQVTDTTRAGNILATLPAPVSKLPVVVYEFQDQTGQLKQNEAFAEYSSAVTKGGLAVLVKALLDTGEGNWFMVAERNGLDNLLKERQIIRAMRNDYTTPDGKKLGELPPMIYGGMMLEGGIIFYDSNIMTGGAAAGYFGITGSTQYRRDMISVYLRAVDIKNGQVILAVNSSKTVFSYGVSAGVTRYLSLDKLLEAEAGFTVNEPSQLAVRQAIETAVYSLVMEGAERRMWGFADMEAGKQAMAKYQERKRTANNTISGTAPAEAERIVPATPAAAKSEKSDSSFSLFGLSL